MRIAGKYLVTFGFVLILIAFQFEIVWSEYFWTILIVPGFILAYYGFRRMDEEEKKHVRNGVHA